MKKIILLSLLLVFYYNVSAQFYVGVKMNNFVCNNLSSTDNDNSVEFVPIEISMGYAKDLFSIDAAFYNWKYLTSVNNEDNSNETYFYTVPLTVRKVIKSSYADFPVSFNPGLKYSFSFGSNGSGENYFMHGPGYDMSLGVKFSRFEIFVGTMASFEIFGKGYEKFRTSMYMAWITRF